MEKWRSSMAQQQARAILRRLACGAEDDLVVHALENRGVTKDEARLIVKHKNELELGPLRRDRLDQWWRMLQSVEFAAGQSVAMRNRSNRVSFYWEKDQWCVKVKAIHSDNVISSGKLYALDEAYELLWTQLGRNFEAVAKPFVDITRWSDIPCLPFEFLIYCWEKLKNEEKQTHMADMRDAAKRYVSAFEIIHSRMPEEVKATINLTTFLEPVDAFKN